MSCRRVGKALLLLAGMVCLVWLVPPATALDSNARIVRLSYVNGDVQFDRRDGQGYGRAIMNLPVVQGARLWTRGEDALAEVEFEDGSTLRLVPETAVEFQEMSLRGSGEKVTSVDVQNGTAYFDVRKHMGDFRVTFGGQQVNVTGPASFRIFGDKSQFKLAVYKGDVNLQSGGHQLRVRKGETFSMDLSDPSRYNLAKSIAEGSYDDWNQERARYNDSYTSSATMYTGSTDSYYNGSYGSYYSGFSPNYSYGVADLSYYGNYFYAPGWGYVWRPYYRGTGWNPYMDGAWVWYPQFGYTWVSSYPWGWMPYRYGSWNFVPGYGWCWMPGQTWNRWTPTPVVNHPPLGWGAPKAPATPPQSGTAGIVPVGRGWTTVYPPGSRPGTALLPNSKPGWGAPVAGGATTTVVKPPVAATGSNAGAVVVTPPATTTTGKSAGTQTPAAKHGDAPRATRPSTGAKPPSTLRPAPSTPRSQMSAPSSGGWGGGQTSTGNSGGGHREGGWGHSGRR